MDDTRLEHCANAKAKTTFDGELYAPQYALDSKLARIIALWPNLTDQHQQELINHAERLVATLNPENS